LLPEDVVGRTFKTKQHARKANCGRNHRRRLRAGGIGHGLVGLPRRSVGVSVSGALYHRSRDLTLGDVSFFDGTPLADMTPAQIVALVDFRYLTDALTPQDALATFCSDSASG